MAFKYNCNCFVTAIPGSSGDCHCRHLSEHPELLKLETTVKKRCQNVTDPASFFGEVLDDITEEFEGAKKLALRPKAGVTTRSN